MNGVNFGFVLFYITVAEIAAFFAGGFSVSMTVGFALLAICMTIMTSK